MIRRALPALACLAVAATSAAAQFDARVGRSVERPDRAVERAVQWVEAIVSHTPGESDAATRLVGSWTADEVRNLLIDLGPIRTVIRDPRARVTHVTVDKGEIRYTAHDRTLFDGAAMLAANAGLSDTDLVARAIVLHTDAAWLDHNTGPTQQHADGQQIAVDDRVDHWEIARTLAEAFRPRDGRDPDIAFWYRATLASMASIQMWNASHARRAVERFRADAELQFLVGCLHETLATPRVQAVMAVSRLPPHMTLRIGSAKSELDTAASMLERAVKLAPDHAEARLHYGRVLTLAGRPTDAVLHLQRAAHDVTEPEQRYYAQLFLGAALEATNQTSAARTAYEAAAALFPHAQAPRLALSALAYAENRDAALDALEPLFARTASDDQEPDPWWHYHVSFGRDGAELLTEARQRLATPRRGGPFQ